MSMTTRTCSCSCCPWITDGHLPTGCSRIILSESESTTCNRCSTRRFAQRGSTTSGLISTEVNGFVSWIASFAFSLCFLVWAVVPHEYLHQLSIIYLLNTYWALAVPALFLIGVFATVFIYSGLNLLKIRPPESFSLVAGISCHPEYCRALLVSFDQWTQLFQTDRVDELQTAAVLASAAADASSWQQQLSVPEEDALFSHIQDLPLSLVNKIMFRVPVLDSCDTCAAESNRTSIQL